MLRIILILSLVGYVLYKFGLFRQITNPNPPQNFNRRPSNGNINIDPTPDSAAQKAKKRSDYKGGEYVDYEEVK
jgi:hypothetical protein